jgi:hypothetical protein
MLIEDLGWFMKRPAREWTQREEENGIEGKDLRSPGWTENKHYTIDNRNFCLGQKSSQKVQQATLKRIKSFLATGLSGKSRFPESGVSI